jgi:hypothetical protein
MLLDFAAMNQPLDVSWVVGTVAPAELAFYPGAVPLRVIVKDRPGGIEPLREIPGAATIDDALAAYAAALAANPWIERWPMSLAEVTPQPRRGGGDAVTWEVRDRDGMALALGPRFDDGWTLLAISGGRPVRVFGEWDGEHLRPLGVAAGGSYFAWPKRSTAAALARVS